MKSITPDNEGSTPRSGEVFKPLGIENLPESEDQFSDTGFRKPRRKPSKGDTQCSKKSKRS